MPVIFHIAHNRDWPPENRVYSGDTLNTEGFIHCSTAAQLAPVVNRFFRGRDDLTVLVIDADRVRSTIIHENLEGGNELFPHIYGPLDTEAVIDTFALRPLPDGSFPAAAADLSRS